MSSKFCALASRLKASPTEGTKIVDLQLMAVDGWVSWAASWASSGGGDRTTMGNGAGSFQLLSKLSEWSASHAAGRGSGASEEQTPSQGVR